MANRNKDKGDRAERAVRDWATAWWPGSFKTRAGFNDDQGDVIVEHPGGRLVLQVKDVASPTWTAWFKQLAAQVNTCRELSRPRPVLGGVIVHKARGSADPATWRAVVPLGELAELVDTAYQAGHAAGYDRRAADEYARPPR